MEEEFFVEEGEPIELHEGMPHSKTIEDFKGRIADMSDENYKVLEAIVEKTLRSQIPYKKRINHLAQDFLDAIADRLNQGKKLSPGDKKKLEKLEKFIKKQRDLLIGISTQ